ncbi:MAG: phosphotransferase family protein [Spirochaetes bacterium]|nr:phosphotransferase family protein [Spirochaetota bacterium]
MAKIDEPVEVRKGEELDTATVGAFLKDSIPGLEGEISVQQFPSGFSNLTYLIKTANREMILRRPPFGKKPKSGHDMLREYRILKALKPMFRYCPEPLVYTEEPEVMGCPFYVMERIHGLIIRRSLPKGMELTKDQARTLSENLVKVLCELHSIDYRKAGLGDFGKPEGYVKRQVEGWIGRYRDARTPDAPDYEDIMAWLAEKMPGDTPTPCVIHNDYKFDNVVLDENNPLEIIGILDWEMATIGDPLMDLGNSLAYWVEKDDPPNIQLIRMIATNIDGMLSRKDQVDLYSKIMGRTINNFDFYFCFGLFRLAVIAQQIYYRYYHGQTKDERFKMLIGAVKILETVAKQVIADSNL